MVKMEMRRAPHALTERGLYMLATILKGEVATRATLAIVNTYAKVRSMVRDKVLAAHFPFKISNLRLTMSRRFGIIESF